MRKPNFKGAWTYLAAFLTLTVFAALYIKATVESDARREFSFNCNEIRLYIVTRLAANTQVLRSGVSLFDASEAVTRSEWKIFSQDLQFEQQLPGTQGIGFSVLIPRDQLPAHIKKIRGEGFQNYNVWPAGDRNIYSSIIYLEPFSIRNQRAFGYDMFSERVRRKAMERARDENSVAISGKVRLVQETGKDVQAGTLMYAPVYRQGMPIHTVAQRRAAIVGWVYSPFRMKDLMNGILSGWEDKLANRNLILQIYDGDSSSSKNILYDSQDEKKRAVASTAGAVMLRSVDIAGHRWTLRFVQLGGLVSSADYREVWFVLLGGIVISILLFWLILSLHDTRNHAQQMADKATIKLRESEEKYRIIFDNEIYAICIFDLETLELLDVNDAFENLYGFSREELISGMTIHDITAEHEASNTDTIRASHEGAVFIPIRYHRKKDGTVITVEIVGGAYTWKHRKVMFGLIHDITERLQAEKALSESEEQLTAIMDNSGSSICMKDMDGRYIRVNRVFQELFHMNDATIKGKSDHDLFSPEMAEAFIRNDQLVFQTGKLHRIEETVIVDGEQRTYLSTKFPLRTALGEIYAVCGIATDITDLKLADDALRVSEQKYRSLIETTNTGYLVLDAQGIVLEANTEYVRLSGHNELADILGRNVLEWTDVNSQEKYAAALARCLQERIIRDLEINQTGIGGNTTPVEITATVIGTGDDLRIISLCHDISERRQTEEEKAILDQQMQHAARLESLGVLAGGIAHDFNNILMIMLGNAELSMADIPPHSPARDCIKEIITGGLRAAELCQQMLAYSGKTSLSIEQVNLGPLVEEMTHLLKTSITNKADLVMYIDRETPPLLADPSQLRQIVMNLIINASEAIGDGSGIISISVGSIHCDEDYLKSTHLTNSLVPGNYVQMQVTDTGCGMDPDTLLRIFEPFYTTKFTGRGLGLAAVMGIVRSYHGALKVYSEPGKGTTFNILFPAIEVPEPSITDNPDLLPNTWSGTGVILFVDDEVLIRTMGVRFLKRIGFSVITAVDGINAVDIYREHGAEIDLVMLDMTMPRMGGAEVYHQLREMNPDVQVLIMSGYSKEDISARFEDKALVGVLQKPFTLNSLREMLKEVMPQQV